jgi:NAD(P)H-dependent FMN reductase
MLYDAMAESDVFLFATPVYWYGPTAIMKAFLDRLVVFNGPDGRPLVRGKTALLVSAWEERGMTAAEPLVRLFELGFKYLELRSRAASCTTTWARRMRRGSVTGRWRAPGRWAVRWAWSRFPWSRFPWSRFPLPRRPYTG